MLKHTAIGFLCAGAASTFAAARQTCVGSTEEVNLHTNEVVGTLESNYQSLVLNIEDNHRLFY